MTFNPSQLRANLRLISGLTLLAFVVCHLTAHAMLLISMPFAGTVLYALMAPWRTLPGTVILTAAFLVHYLNALWSIYRRRSLRLSSWEIWQLALGLCIPLLLTFHVIDTRIAELTANAQPTYASSFVIWWVLKPWFAAVQFTTVVVVWTHACIGLNFWLRTKAWYSSVVAYLRPIVLLLPTLALAGFITTGNQVRREAVNNPEAARIVMEDANYTAGNRNFILMIALITIGGHITLTALPFAARAMRDALYRRKHPPVLTHATGRRMIVRPGASVLETLRDNGVPHAAVCGGRARCTTCRIMVTQGADALEPPEPMEAEALARIEASPGMRLACQLYPTTNLSIVPLLSPEATAIHRAVRGGLEGSERPVTVLFVDLRGSTAISETRLPYDVLFLLNHFFHEMTKALDDTGGHYSQFTGDGLMALYGLDGDVARGAENAVRGARTMLAYLDRLNRELAGELNQPLRIGIGIHFSEAIVGAMGPPKSQIITAIGDTVNTCARLESLTKDYGCAVIISKQAAEAAGLDLRGHTLHEAAVKGRAAMVTFYALSNLPEMA